MRVPKPDRLVEDVSEWWRYLSAKQATGYGCALVGIVLTILTAVVTGSNQLLIAVIAIFAQGIAAFLFASHGKAHPTHAKSALGRLLTLAERVRVSESVAQANFEAKGITAGERQTQMGILSAELSWIGEGIYSAAADWIAFNEPLNELVSEGQRKEILKAAGEAKQAADAEAHSVQVNDDELQLSLDVGDESGDRT